MFCEKCGAEIEDGSVFCEKCGARIEGDDENIARPQSSYEDGSAGRYSPAERDCEQVVMDAIDAGYRLIDTASSYQNEEAVGRAVRNCGVPRDELFITTKAYIQEMGYDNTMQAFERSLDKLGLDYLDLYLIHMPFGDYYGSWRAMEDLYRAGKVRAIGVCNFQPDRLLDLCFNAEIKPQIDQIERHPHYQRAEDIKLMEELDIQPRIQHMMIQHPILLEIAFIYP